MQQQLQSRLDTLNQDIEQHVQKHNEMIFARDKDINESLSKHNVLVGRKMELEELLKQEVATPEDSTIEYVNPL